MQALSHIWFYRLPSEDPMYVEFKKEVDEQAARKKIRKSWKLQRLPAGTEVWSVNPSKELPTRCNNVCEHWAWAKAKKFVGRCRLGVRDYHNRNDYCDKELDL